MKLNVLLAKTDSLAPSFKKGIIEYAKFFKDKQGAFLGERKTYEARPDTLDEPSMKGNTLVQTTVKEKFEYFVEGSKDYINALFSQEKTNASGTATADVIVDGEVLFAALTSAELLRLKNILSASELEAMYSNLPVRSDAEEWEPTEFGDYTLQRFSGAASQSYRAGILKRRTKLLTAITEALKVANEIDAVPSIVTADKIFDYLHGAK